LPRNPKRRAYSGIGRVGEIPFNDILETYGGVCN